MKSPVMAYLFIKALEKTLSHLRFNNLNPLNPERSCTFRIVSVAVCSENREFKIENTEN